MPLHANRIFLGQASLRQPFIRCIKLGALAMAIACYQASPLAAAPIQWSAQSGNAWLTSGNWGGTIPSATDIAQFGANPTSPSTGVGINFNGLTNNGANNQIVGAISVTSARGNNLTIGNSSTAAAGSLTLSGQTLNSVTGTILANFATDGGALTLQNTQGSGNKTMEVVLGTPNAVIQAKAGTGSVLGNLVAISSKISGGSSITFLGGGNNSTRGGQLLLTGANTFSGGLIIGNSDGTQGGEVLIQNQAAALPSSGNITVNPYSSLKLDVFGSPAYGDSSQTLTLNGIGALSNSNLGTPGALHFANTSGTAQWLGSTNLASDAVIYVNSGGVGKLAGAASGAGALDKQGAGTLQLAGTNNLTGATLIEDGNIVVLSGSSLGTGPLTFRQLVNASPTVSLSNAAQTIGNLESQFTSTNGTIDQTLALGANTALTIVQTANTTFGIGGSSFFQKSFISGGGSVTLASTSTGTLTLTATNTYTGQTKVNGGTLIVNGRTEDIKL